MGHVSRYLVSINYLRSRGLSLLPYRTNRSLSLRVTNYSHAGLGESCYMPTQSEDGIRVNLDA